MGKYLLGVDGGNTKTDYLLFTTDGDFVDVMRTYPCSHEAYADGYDGMQRAMQHQLDELLAKNKIQLSDIQAAGMGLAGADLPSQVAEIKSRVGKIGYTNFNLSNDGILGIKGALDCGIGICAVNGTATVVLGTDETGAILQIGGIGQMSGDAAGGTHIARQVISRLYDSHFRCGEDSDMFPQVLEFLETTFDDLPLVLNNYALIHRNVKNINRLADKAAMNGDPVAMRIFDAVGESVARGVAGCTKRLSFKNMGTPDNPINMVLVGSIWQKIGYKGMHTTFMDTAKKLSGKHFKTVTMNAPPAVGGVLWAKELLDGAVPSLEFRKKVIDAIPLEKYGALALGK